LKHARSYVPVPSGGNLSRMLAIVAILFHGFLSVAHAGVIGVNRNTLQSNDYIFPLIICTPSGIKVITKDDFIQGEEGNGLNIGGSCPICQIAATSDIILTGFNGSVLLRKIDFVTGARDALDILIRVAPRYNHRLARAPPFGFSL